LKTLGSSTELDATRVSSILLLVLAASFTVSLSGCTGDDEPESDRRVESAAPPQPTARLLAVRFRPGPPPYFNPPRFDLLTMNEDGSDERVLVRSPRRGDMPMQRAAGPAWSPSGDRIYFTGVVGERETDQFTYPLTDVFVVRADGSGLQRLTNTRGGGAFARPPVSQGAVVPSPDGRTLLFAITEHPGERPFTTGLWMMNTDGTGERRLLEAEEGWLDLPGSWSPDGRAIAFTRCRWMPPGPEGMTPNTCTVQTVSSTGTDLTELAERATAPAYSPDGERIAFLSDRDENGTHPTGSDEVDFANELYVMDSDGGNLERLTETERLDEESPSWSPDGERIAYAREGPASFVRQLMVVEADGDCATRIAGDASISDARKVVGYEQPAWRPGRVTGERSELDC
jgi:Tol biopolymer transport system component